MGQIWLEISTENKILKTKIMTRCKDIKTPKQGMYKTFQNMWSKGYLQNCNAPNLTAKKQISISHWQINQLTSDSF